MEQDPGGRLLCTQLHQALCPNSQSSTAAHGQVGGVEVEGQGVCLRQGRVVGQGGACTQTIYCQGCLVKMKATARWELLQWTVRAYASGGAELLPRHQRCLHTRNMVKGVHALAGDRACCCLQAQA